MLTPAAHHINQQQQVQFLQQSGTIEKFLFFFPHNMKEKTFVRKNLLIEHNNADRLSIM